MVCRLGLVGACLAAGAGTLISGYHMGVVAGALLYCPWAEDSIYKALIVVLTLLGWPFSFSFITFLRRPTNNQKTYGCVATQPWVGSQVRLWDPSLEEACLTGLEGTVCCCCPRFCSWLERP